MKVACFLALSASTVTAFAPTPFAVRYSTAVRMADYDLDYGKKNTYVPAEQGDGGQGQFGARSPNDWRVPGTSPVGQSSYGGADDGGDEPWFSEAVSTVSLDLKRAEDTLKAFTQDAAKFKVEDFTKDKPKGFTSVDKALDELTGQMGYDKFLEATPKQLQKAWEAIHPGAFPETKKAA